jgi:hypothetical protein
MIKIALILLAVVLLGSSAPMPEPPGQYEVHGTVYGIVSSGSSAPIGEYTAIGTTLSEATRNAELLEEQVRLTATANAQPKETP